MVLHSHLAVFRNTVMETMERLLFRVIWESGCLKATVKRSIDHAGPDIRHRAYRGGVSYRLSVLPKHKI